MRAILLKGFGPPDKLKLVDVPAPELREGMVRVRVHYAGLNFADVFGRLGVYPSIPDPPFIPGIEFSGTVIDRGPGVRDLRIGARVVGFSRQGAYAEEACVPAHHVFPIPRAMSFETAAAFLVTYLSAWHGLRTLAHARRGETVLIHAAAGGVGTAALQLGNAWNLRMIGTASSHEKLEVAKQQGADHVIDYMKEDFEEHVRELLGGNLVDVVMDSVGGKVLRKSWRLLAPMGRYVLYGFAAAAGRKRLDYVRLAREFLAFPFLVPSSLPTRNISLMGFNLYFLADKTVYFREVGRNLMRMYEKKQIVPVIGKVFPFEQAAEAHTFLQSRKSIGKVLLKVR